MPSKKRHGSKSSDKAKSTHTDENLPVFDEAALSALTAKIERGLQTAQNPTNSNKKADGSSGGKKRDSRGIVKSSDSAENGAEASKTNKTTTNQNDHTALLESILALGGTEEDFDLVADAESDSEDFDNDQEPEIEDETVLDADLVEKEPEIPKPSSAPKSGSIPKPQKIVFETKDKNVENPENISTKAEKPSKESAKLMFDPRSDWHATPLPKLPVHNASETAAEAKVIAELKEHAYELLEQDSERYTSKHLSSTSSQRFLSTIMSSGTLSDKISALTLVVQESPVHTRKSFESLLALAKKRSRGQAVTALGALKDLLGMGVVLPADRRLYSFANQPGLLGTLQATSTIEWYAGNKLPGTITKTHLVAWAYEDWLKETYFDMLKVLEGWCNDEISFARARAMNYVFELLREKPEQEANLLRLLVNKLGDPEKKLASRASYLILQLQNTHPMMKDVIIHTINTELLLRPGQSSNAKYYAITTLNQTILSTKEEELARKLLDIYFNMFVTLLRKPTIKPSDSAPVFNKKGEIQGGGGPKGKKAREKAMKEELAKQANEETTEKMISAILTGVNRAFPFARSDDIMLENHMETLFKITHSSNFNTSLQALMLIQQLSSSKNLSVDRFYRTLYESLLDSRLVTSSKHAMYLNLLYRALKSDLNIKRVKAFVKRLSQIITLHDPPFICATLYLLRELEVTFPGLSSLLSEPENGDDMDEEVFKDVPDIPETGASEATESDLAVPTQGHVGYDGRKRDPEHSNAERSCLWELLPFISHFHPSVSLFATRLLNGAEMPPKPDLTSHTLISFLDRFVYRNAKSAAGGMRGSSIMQPYAAGDNHGIFFSNRPLQGGLIAVNSETFWQQKAEDIAVDKVFFHKYFKQLGKAKSAASKKAAQKKTQEEGDEEEPENEEQIWKALVESNPEVEGYDDDEEDGDLLDLDDLEDNSSEEAGETAEEMNLVESEDEGGLGDLGDIDNADLDEDDEELDDDDDLPETQHLKRKVNEGAEHRGRKAKRTKLKDLPTFASVDDYAELMKDDEEGV